MYNSYLLWDIFKLEFAPLCSYTLITATPLVNLMWAC